jgi:hypothetical protein
MHSELVVDQSQCWRLEGSLLDHACGNLSRLLRRARRQRHHQGFEYFDLVDQGFDHHHRSAGFWHRQYSVAFVHHLCLCVHLSDACWRGAYQYLV